MKKNVELAPRNDKKLADKKRLTCHHYWIIGKASGPTSRGVCKYCGVKKEFSNLIPDYQWDSGLYNKPDYRVPSLGGIGRKSASIN
jgi:hypothetical protein